MEDSENPNGVAMDGEQNSIAMAALAMKMLVDFRLEGIGFRGESKAFGELIQGFDRLHHTLAPALGPARILQGDAGNHFLGVPSSAG